MDAQHDKRYDYFWLAFFLAVTLGLALSGIEQLFLGRVADMYWLCAAQADFLFCAFLLFQRLARQQQNIQEG